MPVSINNPKYRTDEPYLAFHVQRSRKNRGKVLGGNIYQEPKTVTLPWVQADKLYSIDGTQIVNTPVIWGGLLQSQSTYQINFTVKTYVAGNVFFENINTTGDVFNAVGDYTIDFYTLDDSTLNLVGDTLFNGQVIINTIKRVA